MMCVDCMRELDHCHGTLIVHHDGFVECTHDGCAQPDQVHHAPIIDCDTVLGGCGCAVFELLPILQRAS